ncbi:MAG: ribonuclease HII [Kiritimatiellia bacterium]
MLAFEQQAWTDGRLCVAGIDEAGRGPWAGPVVASAIHIRPDFLRREEHGLFAGLTDSKKLSATRREHFFGVLTACEAVRFGIGFAEAHEIDSINILQATYLAMRRAFDALNPPPDFALVDGNRLPPLPCAARAIVGGDGKSLSIAAASILAKVTRDRLLVKLDRMYPQYGFARHKGYGTAEHSAALKKFGPAPVHRMSFRPVRECLEPRT